MSAFIAKQIIKQAKISEEKGQTKYKAYFVRTHLYEDWREDTDVILDAEGYANVIVKD